MHVWRRGSRGNRIDPEDAQTVFRLHGPDEAVGERRNLRHRLGDRAERFGWRTGVAIAVSFGGVLVLGFDPLVLGYEKKQSVFLPPEYLRGIFSLSGIVMPPVLLHGSVAGRWKHSGKRLLITQFRPFSQEERGFAEAAAAQLWDEAVQPVFQDA